MKPLSSQQEQAHGERLESWKEIAVFLGKGVRTVQRWEQTENLPVRRHQHERAGTVYAYKSEILEWYQGRQLALESERGPLETSWRPGSAESRPRILWWLIGAVLTGLLAVAVFLIPGRSLSATGPGQTLLSVAGRASQVALSPDGAQFAFVWNGERESENLDIYVKPVEGGQPERITFDAKHEHSPSWSADGKSLLFLRDGEGIYQVRLGETLPILVARQAKGAAYGVGSSLSIDGNWFFYAERRAQDEPLRIHRLNIASRQSEPLTSPAADDGDMYPALSPDQTSIAFQRFTKSNAGHICVLPLKSKGQGRADALQLTRERSGIAGLDWTPDGKGIVFSSDLSGHRRLMLLRRTWRGWNTNLEILPLAGEDAFQPNVSNLAGTLAYSRRFWTTAIWKLPIDEQGTASAPAVKLVASTRQESEPAFSSDGQRIAFISNRTGHNEVWIANADGSGAHQLTKLGVPFTHSPAWSADGKSIAFISGVAGQFSIFIVASSGGTPVRLTPEGMQCFSPAWSPDSKTIYFTANQDATDQIWKIPASGGQPAQLTSDSGILPQVSSDGLWIYFRRNGVWRRSITNGNEFEVVPGVVGNFAVAGNRLYFDRGSGDYVSSTIYVVDLTTGEQRTVTDFDNRKSVGISASPDGRFLLIPLNDRQSSEILLTRWN